MFKIAAQFTRANHKVDGSMGIGFVTQDLPACDKLKLIEHLNLAGWIIFSEDNISEVDIPKEDSGYDEGKSPSERIRAIMYVYWKEKLSDTQPIFDTFYKKACEKIIEQYKASVSGAARLHSLGADS